jgi:hypothetical protein
VNYLTPLPGSEDHKRLYEAGVWMDPDMNKYTLTHRVSHHPVMSDEDWDWVYREFHARYYTFAHMETILRRMVAVGSTRRMTTINRLVSYREAVMAEGVSMLESGYVRVRSRRQRRSGLGIENPLIFYPWHAFKTLRGIAAYVSTSLRLWAILRRIDADPKRSEYRDAALTLARDDALVASTRVTDYARRRIANSARARAEAET